MSEKLKIMQERIVSEPTNTETQNTGTGPQSQDHIPSNVPPSSEERTQPPLGDDAPPPPPPPPPGVDASYFEKLLLFIPADAIAGYLTLDGILKQSFADVTLWTYWAVFISLLVLTPLYICFKPSENSILKCSMRFRLITGTLAFAVWVFALGGPFAVTFDWYKPVFGSLLLIITTLAIPVLEKVASRFDF